MKKILLRLFVLVGLLVFTVPAYADLWNGSVNVGGGITATTDWNASSTKLTWDIDVLDSGWVSYNYKWEAEKRALYYIILEISQTATLEHFAEFLTNGQDYGAPKLFTYQAAGSNDPDEVESYPGMPSTLYGLKIGGDGSSVEFSFLSKRLPMWGNFYTNNGDGLLYAYNTGFGTTASDNGNFIAVPDTKVPEVPIPAAVWLFGTGLFGLVGVRRRMFRA